MFPDRKGWQAEVAKMVNVNGAVIADQEPAAVLDYLEGLRKPALAPPQKTLATKDLDQSATYREAD